MKKLSTIILTILPLIIWAHQDKYYTYVYGNVTVRFETGFFFEEINNAKIIGKYASLLSDSIDYDKPILLDFIHDYGHNYQGNTFSFMNIGSEEYDLVSYYEHRYDSLLSDNVYYMVPYSDSIENKENVEKDVYTVPRINRQKKIVIRQFGFHFNIAQTLNLLYFAINNETEVKRLSKTDTLLSYLINMNYCLETVSSNLIDSIKFSTFQPVERVLQNRVYREVDTINRYRLYYSYFYQNKNYYIFAGLHDKEIILDTLRQVYSFNPIACMPAPLFVFESPDQMRRYESNILRDYQFQRSIIHKISIDLNEYISSIDIKWLGDDIYLINYIQGFRWTPFNRLIYLAKDDVLIEDFESYINSFRNEKR